MKKILIYIPKLYHGGGGERSSLALGNVLAKDHEVSFFTQHAGDITQNTEPIYCLDQKENIISKTLDFIPTARALKSYCIEHDIDIVISNMARANTITILSKILFGNKTKNILITRNANSGKKIHDLWMKLWKYADMNVAVSYGAEHVLNKKGLQNTTTIYNAYNIPSIREKLDKDILPDHKQYFDDEAAVFLNIGRLHKQKAQADLIRAFSQFVTTHNNARLLIAGGGHLENELRSLINELNMQEHIHLLGNLPNVFPYLREADCFVLSSNWEGLPTVVVEALISGTYIISTDCMSGPREILTDEPYGKDLSYPYYGEWGALITPPIENTQRFIKDFVDAAAQSISHKTKMKNAEIDKYSFDAIRTQWNALLKLLEC